MAWQSGSAVYPSLTDLALLSPTPIRATYPGHQIHGRWMPAPTARHGARKSPQSTPEQLLAHPLSGSSWAEVRGDSSPHPWPHPWRSQTHRPRPRAWVGDRRPMYGRCMCTAEGCTTGEHEQREVTTPAACVGGSCMAPNGVSLVPDQRLERFSASLFSLLWRTSIRRLCGALSSRGQSDECG